MASQLIYDFEFDCKDLINHISHWPAIDFVATRAPAQNINGVYTIYSQRLPLCTGYYRRYLELKPIREKDKAVMDNPLFEKLLPYATRLKAILLHVTIDREKADEDLDDEAFEVMLQQIDLMKLDQEDLQFFEEHGELIEEVSTITARTKLTLAQFKKKWETVLKNKTIKLLQIEDCKVAFVAPNPVRGGQIAHGQNPLYVMTNPHDGTDDNPVGLMNNSFSAISIASPPPKTKQ